ncbi:hypothetical protein DWY54_08415 [Parabacteroides distasonis]|uniref:Uncharacterized protein n=1 Tax=Phocaeicola vulgatus TaxID=821 RepID=A0A412VM22_PHOVU|nr:hypothetical protein DWY54_08415 [Parabacteroides distasonis]RGV08461.1 hypothetical protein DWW27_11780 [Phocaeicola vulgatus]RGZ53307.1 hypothetical protein DW984_21985 [Parabacteroides distasonis]
MNRYIVIHTYEYDKPEEEAIGAALLRACFVCSLSDILRNSPQVFPSVQILRRSAVICLPGFRMICRSFALD